MDTKASSIPVICAKLDEVIEVWTRAANTLAKALQAPRRSPNH